MGMAQLQQNPMPLDFDGALMAATGDKFAYCHGKYLLAAPSDHPTVACDRLTDAATFSGILDRYETKYPGADRRAVASMWSMHYFSTLMISAAVHHLALRRTLPLGLGDLRVVLDPKTAEPRAFVLAHTGVDCDRGPVHASLGCVIRDHAEPLIEAIAGHARLAKKLLWTNVSAYFSWIIKEIGHQIDPKLSVEGLVLVNEPVWPDGWKNPMFGMIRVARQQCGLEFSNRKVCCLRYALPGVSGCGDICPLPHGKLPVATLN
jgi:ferric iron reductase protein FhuF